MYEAGDFFDMKGVCEEFFEKAGMKILSPDDPQAGKTYLHPGRQANIIYGGKIVGYLARRIRRLQTIMESVKKPIWLSLIFRISWNLQALRTSIPESQSIRQLPAI